VAASHAPAPREKPSLRRRLFAALYDRLTSSEEIALAPFRERTAGRVHGDVLELGAGTGANLPFYARDVRLVVFEPNAAMASRLEKRAARLGIPVQVDVTRQDRLPYADASFDAVVATFVLCSVDDVAGVLNEVRRVLRPGGRFWFIEHVAADEPGVRRWQRRLNPIQRFLADGCELDRQTGSAIDAAPFREASIEAALLDGAGALTRHLIVGSALA
jgi:SAM-dependent methyltransferase